MTLMPWLGKTEQTEHWTDGQRAAFVVLSYLTIFFSLALLVLTTDNFFRYIVACKQDESKARVCKAKQPLLIFYTLVTCALCTDILFSVLIV